MRDRTPSPNQKNAASRLQVDEQTRTYDSICTEAKTIESQGDIHEESRKSSKQTLEAKIQEKSGVEVSRRDGSNVIIPVPAACRANASDRSAFRSRSRGRSSRWWVLGRSLANSLTSTEWARIAASR